MDAFRETAEKTGETLVDIRNGKEEKVLPDLDTWFEKLKEKYGVAKIVE